MSATQPKGNPGVANRSAPKSPVVPVLVYEDVGKAIEWLCGAFGFTERLRAAGPGGGITHAQLTISGGDIMIGAAGADFRPPRPNEVNQYALVRVEDVERHCDYAKRFGARLARFSHVDGTFLIEYSSSPLPGRFFKRRIMNNFTGNPAQMLASRKECYAQKDRSPQ